MDLISFKMANPTVSRSDRSRKIRSDKITFLYLPGRRRYPNASVKSVIIYLTKITNRGIDVGSLIEAALKIGVEIYTVFMPCKVYVQMKDVTKASVILTGVDVITDQEEGELIVKNVVGETLGCFKLAAVSGWWIEREPVDLGTLWELLGIFRRRISRA